MKNDKFVSSAAAIRAALALFVFLFLGLSALGTRALGQETNPKKCPELVKAEADLKAAQEAEQEAQKAYNKAASELSKARQAFEDAVKKTLGVLKDPSFKEDYDNIREAEQGTQKAERAVKDANSANPQGGAAVEKAEQDLSKAKDSERDAKEDLLRKFKARGPNGEDYAQLLAIKEGEFFGARLDLRKKIEAKEKAEEEVIRIKCPAKTPPVIPKIPIPRLPRWWFSMGYSYLRAPDEDAKNLNGFNASLAYNIRPWIAAKADFTYGYGEEGENVEVTGRVGGSEVTYQGLRLHRFLYLFGPQFNAQAGNRVQVFGDALFGGVHDTTKFRLGTTTTTVSANAFAATFGGGVDVNIGKRLFIRPAQLRYVLTRFGGHTQNNFQFAAGIGFRFAGRK